MWSIDKKIILMFFTEKGIFFALLLNKEVS